MMGLILLVGFSVFLWVVIMGGFWLYSNWSNFSRRTQILLSLTFNVLAVAPLIYYLIHLVATGGAA